MGEREIKNAVITSTMLGIEDHGIMSCYIWLDYGGSCQSFGGYSFDEYCKVTKKRIGTAWGMQFIKEILDVVGVTKWEDLKGKHIRVDADFGNIYRIGNIINDKWFEPKSDLKLLEGRD